MRRFRLRGVRVTPSLVIATVALFVALSSTGVAATIVPLAKRALTADKAKSANKAKVADLAKVANTAKTAESAGVANTAGDASTVNGLTAAQIAALPGSSSNASLLSVKSVGWSVQQIGLRTDARVLCNTGEKAVGGGYDQANGFANVTYNRPLTDGTGWMFQVVAAPGNTVPANGSAWVICTK